MHGGLSQLAVQVLPLADPQVVEVLALAHPAERAAGQLALLLLQVAPEVEQRDEVGVLVGEAGVRCVGLLPLRPAAARAGPGCDSAATMTSTSRRQPCRSASRTIRASRGSIGSAASLRPVGGEPLARVGRRSSMRAAAPRAAATPSVIWRESGGSTNGKRAMSPRPSDVICRMTEARLVRRISGSVNSGRDCEVLLGVQPDADAVGDPAAAAGPLVGARPGEIGSIGSRCTLVRWL